MTVDGRGSFHDCKMKPIQAMETGSASEVGKIVLLFFRELAWGLRLIKVASTCALFAHCSFRNSNPYDSLLPT